MIDGRFVILGALLSLAGSTRYAVQTVRGRTRPNRVTWLLWAVAPIIGFLAQLDGGVGLPSIMTLSVGVGPAIIFLASFVNRVSFWRIALFDVACGLASVVALVVWLSLGDPRTAVVFAVLADLLAGVPTIRKAWTDPATENGTVFVLSAANAAVTLFTIDRWDVATWAFPVYIAVIGASLFLIVQCRLGVRWRTRRPGYGAPS